MASAQPPLLKGARAAFGGAEFRELVAPGEGWISAIRPPAAHERATALPVEVPPAAFGRRAPRRRRTRMSSHSTRTTPTRCVRDRRTRLPRPHGRPHAPPLLRQAEARTGRSRGTCRSEQSLASDGDDAENCCSSCPDPFLRRLCAGVLRERPARTTPPSSSRFGAPRERATSARRLVGSDVSRYRPKPPLPPTPSRSCIMFGFHLRRFRNAAAIRAGRAQAGTQNRSRGSGIKPHRTRRASKTPGDRARAARRRPTLRRASGGRRSPRAS